MVFRKIALLEPPSAEAYYDLGAALFESGELAEAGTSLERALELRPNLAEALRVLATVQEHLGRESEAAANYRRLVRLTKDSTERRLLLARALNLEGASDEAEAELRRAIAAAPNYAGIRVLLGQQLLEKGEFEEAERHLLQVVDEFPDVFQHLAASRPITEADRPLLDHVFALIKQRKLNPLQRGAVHFGLGKAHDDLREYKDAMAHYEAGNIFCGAQRHLDRPGLTAHYDDLIARYSTAALAGPEAAKPNGPSHDDLPILVVGMPRSGTTLVEQILSSHPAVAGAGELSFWSDRCKQWLASSKTAPLDLARTAPASDPIARLLASRTPRSAVEKASLSALTRQAPDPRRVDQPLLTQAARDYYSLLRQIGPEDLRVVDKAPFNFERLGQIRAALPHIRIIHCKRRPIDTCLSIFFTNYKGRQAWGRDEVLFQYRQYQRLMAHWRSVLADDRFIEVDYEAVVADRDAQTRRLVAFCGLDWDDACLAPQENRRVVKSASLWQARQPMYTKSMDRWRHYEPWLGELRELLPDAG